MSLTRKSERGYNLVEVLVAMAILSSVLLSIITLFFFGRRNVYSGKQMTLANAVATRVSEDLIPLSRNTLYSAFAVTDATTLSDPTVAGKSYDDVYVVSTANVATDPQGYLGRWKTLMQEKHFQDGRVSLVLKPTMAETGKPFTSADIVQIRIVVEWKEGRRSRTVVLDTVKVDS